jgi:beta-phosphoglucomutase-like phosphatase (HAD superfamily)
MSESVTAVFDVDGTLVDSNYLHAVTWWEAFSQGGYDVAVPTRRPTVRTKVRTLADRVSPPP